MRTRSILMVISLAFVFGCEKIQSELQGDIGPSSLSEKPSILKVSYTEVAQRKAEFAEGTPEGHHLTYIEEPRSERMQVYIEIYDDLTYSKQIDYLDPHSDFPADNWKLPDDMPEMKTVIYSNGFARGYDASGNLILEEPFEDAHWIDPSEFDSMEEAMDYVINSYFNPRAIASETLERVSGYSDRFEMLDGKVAVATNRLAPQPTNQSPSARATATTDEVVEEKTYFLPEYGAVFRTEGYTSDGTLKDIEHNFYQFTADSAFVMSSSHYRNNEYSAAYDLSFVEYSDIFFENHTIQRNKN